MRFAGLPLAVEARCHAVVLPARDLAFEQQVAVVILSTQVASQLLFCLARIITSRKLHTDLSVNRHPRDLESVSRSMP
jgi:hypothetical protein